ncbi:hypothetical protein MJ560_03045 [Klebsiella pneumoniae]|nr:hypothetical protein MJ560_03045 [Klebsiella pneumoniae]
MLMKMAFGWRFSAIAGLGLWLTKGQQPPHIHAIARLSTYVDYDPAPRFYHWQYIKQRVGPGQYRQRW